MRINRSRSLRKKRHLAPQFGVARVLSKLGVCSRAEAGRWIMAGRVTLNGRLARNAEQHVPGGAEIRVDGKAISALERVYLALNKPRGLVTTADDERGRATVFGCFEGANLPHFAPVGRLDKASEGLLLFTNDTAWAAAITEAAQHVNKVYHVQVDVVADDILLKKLLTGLKDEGEFLAVKRAKLLRCGEHNSWLELTIDEGRNRHLRRLLAALDVEVLRLVRVAIGPLVLGDLAKGEWRKLTPAEVLALKNAGEGK